MKEKKNRIKKDLFNGIVCKEGNRQTAGITLIALVITIIILLILAGITISQLSNSGIFEKAKEAKDKYKNAQENENKVLSEYEKEINGERTIKPFINGSNVGKIINKNEDIKLNEYFEDAKNAEVIFNGTKVTSVKDLPTGQLYLVYNKEQNKIFVIEGDCIEDLSGKNHTLYLKNETQVKKDENGEYYLNFDGIDDYAQINELEESINWADGFTIEFKAQWKALNNWSRILDFGNGSSSDNIILANNGSSDSLDLELYNGSSANSYNKSAIVLNSADTFVINYEKINDQTYNVKIKKNGEEIYSTATQNVLRNIQRTSNYLGKSNWNDPYFRGKIYYLKITQSDGTKILEYDLNISENPNRKIPLNIIDTGYQGKIADLSGKYHDIFLKDGASVQKDSDGKYYISLDGINDYAKINEFEEDIDWTNGYKIEVEASWDGTSFGSYAYLYSFSNDRGDFIGSASNFESSNILRVDGMNFTNAPITLNQVSKYTMNYIKNENANSYTFKILKNEDEIYNNPSFALNYNGRRVTNHFGKSAWPDSYFKGKIYSIKITLGNGNVIIDCDVNKWMELS